MKLGNLKSETRTVRMNYSYADIFRRERELREKVLEHTLKH